MTKVYELTIAKGNLELQNMGEDDLPKSTTYGSEGGLINVYMLGGRMMCGLIELNHDTVVLNSGIGHRKADVIRLERISQSDQFELRAAVTTLGVIVVTYFAND